MIAFKVGGIYLRDYILAMLYIAVVIFFCEATVDISHGSKKKTIAVRAAIALILSGVWQYIYEGAAFIVPTYIMLIVTFISGLIVFIKAIAETVKAPVVTENTKVESTGEMKKTVNKDLEKLLGLIYLASMTLIAVILLKYSGISS